MKKKLLLLETEMRGPGGHYLDNLIESHFFFKNDFETYALLNKAFDAEGTFIPNELNIYKIIKRKNIEKKIINYYIIFLKFNFFKTNFSLTTLNSTFYY